MNRPDLLGPCLDGIEEHTTVSHEVIVVAYMFSEENLSWLRTRYPQVKVVVSDSLRGFAENNNMALPLAKGRFCFVVNDDTLMGSPVIDSLVADYDELLSVWSRAKERGWLEDENRMEPAVVSPKIVFPDGKVQTCGRSKVTPWTYVRHYLHLLDETLPAPGRMGLGIFETYNLNGACFLIRTDIFRKVGWFDETYTFTPEDLALGSLLRQKGFALYADADVSITHIANSTASRMETAIKPTRVKGALTFYSSLLHLRNPQQRPVARLTCLLLSCFVWLVEAARGLKYLAKGVSPGYEGHDAIMAATARNVRRTVFSRMTSKEIFVKLYDEMPAK